jgi:hypothetical protein
VPFGNPRHEELGANRSYRPRRVLPNELAQCLSRHSDNAPSDRCGLDSDSDCDRQEHRSEYGNKSLHVPLTTTGVDCFTRDALHRHRAYRGRIRGTSPTGREHRLVLVFIAARRARIPAPMEIPPGIVERGGTLYLALPEAIVRIDE